MGSADKFCLRWNDFESNISSSFRDLRVNEDFFDVSLAVEEDHVIQAHKVILAACSPFFRNVLAKQNLNLPYGHPHPVIYLRGIKLQDLRHVLDFMYHGEVNVAQEDLNSFLAVAEDLQIKGLTQDEKTPASNTPVKTKKEPVKRAEPPDANNGPPTKKAKSAKFTKTPPSVARAAAANPIEDIPVKTEPSGSGDILIDESSYGEGGDEFGDGGEEDYSQFGEGGEDFGEGMEPQPGTSDGSKDSIDELTMELETFVVNRSGKFQGGYQCLVCEKRQRDSLDCRRHVITHLTDERADDDVIALLAKIDKFVVGIGFKNEKGNFVCLLCKKLLSKGFGTLRGHVLLRHLRLSAEQKKMLYGSTNY